MPTWRAFLSRKLHPQPQCICKAFICMQIFQHDMRNADKDAHQTLSCKPQAVWLLEVAGRRVPASGRGAGLLGLATALLGELRAAGVRRDGGRAFLDTVTPPQVPHGTAGAAAAQSCKEMSASREFAAWVQVQASIATATPVSTEALQGDMELPT